MSGFVVFSCFGLYCFKHWRRDTQEYSPLHSHVVQYVSFLAWKTANTFILACIGTVRGSWGVRSVSVHLGCFCWIVTTSMTEQCDSQKTVLQISEMYCPTCPLAIVPVTCFNWKVSHLHWPQGLGLCPTFSSYQLNRAAQGNKARVTLYNFGELMVVGRTAWREQRWPISLKLDR